MAFFIIPVLIWIWDWRVHKNKEFCLWPFFVWGWFTVAGYGLFLGYLMMIQKSQGFEVSNRYLMSLTPLGIIAVTAAILEIAQRPKSIWLKLIVWAGVLMLILPRLKKAWSWMGRG